MKSILLLLMMTLSCFGGNAVVIKVPPGIHYIDKPIFIEASHTFIIGEPGSILKLSPHSNCPMIVIGSREPVPASTISSIRISGVTLDGNCFLQDSEYMTGSPWLRNNCLTIRGASEVSVYNVVTCYASSGGVVIEKGCSLVLIDGLNSYENKFDGFAGYASTECGLINSNLHSNNAAGISCDWGFNNNRFENVKIEYNKDVGVFMRDSNNNVFRSIFFKYSGIFLGSRDGHDCRNNQFYLDNLPTNVDMDNKENKFFLKKD